MEQNKQNQNVVTNVDLLVAEYDKKLSEANRSLIFMTAFAEELKKKIQELEDQLDNR